MLCLLALANIAIAHSSLANVSVNGNGCAANLETPEGVIGLDLQRAKRSREAIFDKHNSSIPLSDELAWWGIELEIGTPPQKVIVQIDTGSSELWVPGSCENPECELLYTFNASRSSSFKFNTTAPFSIHYKDGSGVDGVFCEDSISLNSDILVQTANFAYVPTTDTSPAVMGIGLVSNEALQPGESHYANFPLQLKQQGVISALAYSLWLDTTKKTSGSLLFGGVDHSKYTGQLQTVPILRSENNGVPKEFFVSVDSLSKFQGNNSNVIFENYPIPGLLDSGTTNIVFPGEMGDIVATALGATWDETRQGYVMDCQEDGGLSFDFSGVSINVPFSHLFDQPAAIDLDAKAKCTLAFDLNSDTLILGDRFLSAAYIVYDLERFEISMAQAVIGPTESRIEVIDPEVGVPGAIRAPYYSHNRQGMQVQSRNDHNPNTKSASDASRGHQNSASVLCPISWVGWIGVAITNVWFWW